MHYLDFIYKLEDIANDYKTSYMLGCFGQPATSTNIANAVARPNLNNSRFEQGALSIKGKGFMFDCVCLIKAVLWGWSGDFNKSYGGAVYGSNGVPDINADQMINKCKDVSTDFSTIQMGEVVWMKGHIGVYVGAGEVIECTPKWGVSPGVKVSMLGNLGFTGSKVRNWTKHGKLPWIDYTQKTVVQTPTVKLIYDSVEDLPDYAKEAVKYYIDKGALKGGSTGLNLTEEMVRILTILYRAKE